MNAKRVNRMCVCLALLAAVLLRPVGTRAQDGQANAVAEFDLLTFAQGVLFVKVIGSPSGSAGSALLAIDGDPYRLAINTDGRGPVEFVYKMPALTTFHRFAIPNVTEWPGNVTFVRSVTVSGSSEGPDSGYQRLVSFELETHGADQESTALVPEVVTPVRWVKVRFEGGILIEEGHEGRTVLRFTELIGNGTQDTRPLSTAFDGIWDLRLTERLDLRGVPLELHQVGATITGCHGDISLRGTVNGAIARATGEDEQGRPSAFVFVADENGTIQAAVSINSRLFGARTAVVDPTLTTTPCSSDAPPAPVACGKSAYINFDLDSATIRSESEYVLDDLFQQLAAEGTTRVAIEGHTSTEGREAYNLSLSERRAQAVVDALVARGFDGSSISAVGKGESEPLISPDRNESARSMNRRVEIQCDSAR